MIEYAFQLGFGVVKSKDCKLENWSFLSTLLVGGVILAGFAVLVR